MQFLPLAHRGLLRVSGPDLVDFLQGLVSNDVRQACDDRAIWAALLTPQGKFLHDLFLVGDGAGGLWLDSEADRLEQLRKKLMLYRLRSKVDIAAETAWSVSVLFGDGALAALGLASQAGAAKPLGKGVCFTDPRLPELGARAILPAGEADALLAERGFARADAAAYESLRIGLGVPDGSRDMAVDKATLLENGFEELRGVDWDKGCFMGQELTARTKYRGLVKKRLLPVAVDGPLPAPGTLVMFEGKEAGEVRSGVADQALALLRLDTLKKAADSGTPLLADQAELHPKKPDWAHF